MQNNPDPDALASAAAMRDLIAARLKKRVLIGYGGVCGRAENRSMMDVLRIDARRITPADVHKAGTVCLVDCQPHSGNTLLFTARPAEIVVDHHLLPRGAAWLAEFVDVRPEYGATSTILYEYLLASGVRISPNLATALFYGIQSDTQELGREAGSPDIAAFQELFLLADKKKLARIRRAPVPAEYFQVLSETLSDCLVAGTTVISRVHEHATPDMIAEIADLMLRLKDARTSVCYGLCGNVIHLSARRKDARSNVCRRMKRVVSRLGTGGGHRTMAGGQIPAGDNPERRLEVVRQRILKVFASSKEPKRLVPLPKQKRCPKTS